MLWKKNRPPNTGWKLGGRMGRDWVGSELVSEKGQKLRVIVKPINGCCQSARYAQSPPRYASSLRACVPACVPSAHDVHSTGSKVLTHCRSSIWSKWAAPLTHPVQSLSPLSTSTRPTATTTPTTTLWLTYYLLPLSPEYFIIPKVIFSLLPSCQLVLVLGFFLFSFLLLLLLLSRAHWQWVFLFKDLF